MAKNETLPSSGAHNVLSIGTTVKGDIFAEENCRIDGNIEGTITCKGRIVVGPQSFIKGKIECANIEVMGTIDGSINCSDTLTVRSTANITGEIAVRILEVEPGAIFHGNSAMSRNSNNSSEYEQ